MINDKRLSDEEYIYMCSMEDKYTKEPTVWELAQAFPDFRYLAAVEAYLIEEDCWMLRQHKKFLRLTKPIEYDQKIDIEKAKQVPIETLYDFRIVRKGSARIQAFCPFHDETNGSFFIYVKQNRFHCFSCQENGDSISFVQKLNNINFVEAVKRINND